MPSNETKCSNCGSDEIDYDPTRGDAACVACGTVVQQSLIVNEISFAEDGNGRSNMVGQHVGADGQPASSHHRSVLPGHSPQATANTMYNARRQMIHLASQLRLSSNSHVDQAVRLYRLAVERNFHKGRRVLNLSCACLYIICRMERTPHMLLDFADVSKINVFTLGHTFLKLVRLLEIQLPLIDPSLYIHRFAAKLEYGELQNTVAMTALRICARMQRDWMTVGRRPAGLCGAALLTAGVMHNFYRSQLEVAKVVRIGNVVLRNRLKEFDQTATAEMTAAQIDAGGGDDGKHSSLVASTITGDECQAPAFIKSQKVKAAAAASVKEKELEGDGNSENRPAEKNKRSVPMSAERRKEIEEIERSKLVASDERVDSLMAQALASKEMQALDTHETDITTRNPKSSQPSSSTTTVTKKRKKRLRKSSPSSTTPTASDTTTTLNQPIEEDDDEEYEETDEENEDEDIEGDEELSDLDDADCMKYLSTEEEFKVKEKLWTETNKEYLEKQARLEIMKRERPEEYKRLRPGKGGGQKKKRKGTGTSDNKRKEKEIDSAPPPRKVSKKLNYQVLQSLAEGR